MRPAATFDDIMEMAHGYQRAMVLFTALDLGLFSALAEGPADISRLARRTSADPRRLSILLNALVAAGVLGKKGAKYRNREAAARFLADGPRSKAAILLHHLDCWPEWTNLSAKIRPGGKGTRKGKGYQENFIRGMEDNARERAVVVARQIPLRRGERMLDLGGGPATYAVEWAKRHPDARVAVFDIPETLAVTRRILEENGTSRLVSLREGDFLRDPIGGPYDFVWISQILHAFSESQCVRILRKARKSLSPEGRIAVQEFLLEEGKTSPPGPAFFSVHMVAVTERGRSYSGGEVASMLRDAGFRKVSTGRPDAQGVGIVQGRI